MEDSGESDQPKEKTMPVVILDNSSDSILAHEIQELIRRSVSPDKPSGSRKRPLSRTEERDLFINKRRRASSTGRKNAARKYTKSTEPKRHYQPRLGSMKKKEKEIPKIEEKNLSKEHKKQLDYLAQFGKNFYCPANKKCTGLRPIYIDGSNVAFSHGQHEQFSVKGLQICIDYFLNRGHDVKAFIPKYRLKNDETSDQKLLKELVKRKLVVITPTLYIKNQQRSPYDDWYIVQTAAANGGIIVSADNFQDIVESNPNLRMVVEERRLVPTFVDDMLIFPMDPHGNRENNLEEFLKF